MAQIDPRLIEIRDALRSEPGVRAFIVNQFDRGRPDLLVGKNQRTSLITVARNFSSADNLPPLERERFLSHWNSNLAIGAARYCVTPAQSLEFANTSFTEPPDDPPDVPPPPADPFENAFAWHYSGQFDTFLRSGANSIIFSEAPDNVNSRVPTVLANHIVLPTDTPRRCEVAALIGTAKTFQEDDETTLSIEIFFPQDLPTFPQNQYIQILRFSASTNGFPPIELIIRRKTDNTEHVYLRHLGTDHDLLGQTTLDLTGGYIWSTPLVRSAGNSTPNYLILTFKIYWHTNPANGWIELYRNYNLTTPLFTRFYGKTLTDTSGTVRCYFRQGINAHSSFASPIRVGYANTNWLTKRPI